MTADFDHPGARGKQGPIRLFLGAKGGQILRVDSFDCGAIVFIRGIALRRRRFDLATKQQRAFRAYGDVSFARMEKVGEVFALVRRNRM
jgi:hypothetical protein